MPDSIRGTTLSVVRSGGLTSAVAAVLRRSSAGLLGLALLLLVGLLLVQGRAGEVQATPVDVLRGVLLLGAVGLGIFLPGGVVSRDVRSGDALLWLQKPVSPTLFYLARFGESLWAHVLLVTSATGLAALLTAVGSPNGGLEVLRLLPLLLLAGSLASCVTFAFSGLGTRLDTALSLLFLGLGTSVAALTLAEPAGWGLVGSVARVAAFPVDELATLQRWLMGGEALDLGASLGRIAGFGTVWLALATLLVHVRTRKPLPRDESR
ncbi:MAG TPA: hypothetical protein VLL48_00390 [Longimicrobiales bacterium]|nr:hypothetical protein [Longimicrobiales bacterium]